MRDSQFLTGSDMALGDAPVRRDSRPPKGLLTVHSSLPRGAGLSADLRES